MTEEMKACPMCEAPARLVLGRVKCTRQGCGTQGGRFDHPRLAIAAWNTRAPTSAENAQVADGVATELASYAEWQQRRGMALDIIDWAVLEYDEFMQDDAFDAQAVLDRIVAKLRAAKDLRESPAKQPLTAGEGVREAIARVIWESDLITSPRNDWDTHSSMSPKNEAVRIVREVADAILALSTPSPLREDHSKDQDHG